MAGLEEYLRGAAAGRPDSISGMDPALSSALLQMFQAAPDDIRAGFGIRSGFRSPDLQAKLFADAVKKYGSEAAARKWVAPPGRSQHNHGRAADLSYANDAVMQWAHQNAGNFGLSFPLSNENWHVELANARNGGAPASPAPQQSSAPSAFSNGLVSGPGQRPDANALFADVIAARQAQQGAYDDLASIVGQFQPAVAAQDPQKDAEAEQRRRLLLEMVGQAFT